MRTRAAFRATLLVFTAFATPAFADIRVEPRADPAPAPTRHHRVVQAQHAPEPPAAADAAAAPTAASPTPVAVPVPPPAVPTPTPVAPAPAAPVAPATPAPAPAASGGCDVRPPAPGGGCGHCNAADAGARERRDLRAVGAALLSLAGAGALFARQRRRAAARAASRE